MVTLQCRQMGGQMGKIMSSSMGMSQKVEPYITHHTRS